MKIAHICPIGENQSGPKNSIPLLSYYLNKKPNTTSNIYSTNLKKPTIINEQEVWPSNRLDVREYNLISFSGIYNFSFYSIYRKCLKNKIPYIISPRSGLIKHSLKKSTIKKLTYMALFGRHFVNNSSSIHFLTEEERKNSLYSTYPSFVVGNIVDHGRNSLNLERKKNIIGFLGRYDIRHKGLDILIKAIEECQNLIRKKNYAVKLHGTNFKGGYDYLCKLVSTKGLSDIVEVGGPLMDRKKMDFLDKTSIFLHTSRWEGQPQAVMEAMAYGSAIIATTNTNMANLIAEANCGVTTKCNHESVSDALKFFLNNELKIPAMQNNAIRYSLSNFNGSSVAESFLNNVKLLVNK